jgi:hypothetical protein
LQPVEYYSKLPLDINERDVFVLDPMLATGGSAIDAISIIKRSNPKSIRFMCIIAAPEGVKALTQAHPDVEVFCAAVDDHLNELGYIVPGLGDAGDRIFFLADRIANPFLPFALLSAIHSPKSRLEMPCPLYRPETHKQSMNMYPFASIGHQAFSAGIYSINTFPLTSAFLKTSPSAKRSVIQAFLEAT